MGRTLRFGIASRFGVSLAVVTFSACDDGPAPGPPVEVDEDGVRVVRSPDSALVYAEIAAVPDLTLGGVNAEGPEVFEVVPGLYSDGGGRVWVAESGSQEIRIFDSDGAHLRSVGGQGDGPGEFNRIRLVGATPSDTVVAIDTRDGRVSWFAPSGDLVRDQRLNTGGRPPAVIAGVESDGDLIGQIPTYLQADELSPGHMINNPAVYVRWTDPDLLPDTVTSAPTALWLWTGRTQLPIPFTANPSIAAGARLFVTSGSAFQIRVFGDEGLEARWAVERPPLEIDAAIRRSYVDFIEGVYSGTRLDEMREAMEHAPSHAPAYVSLIADPDGGVWARRWAPVFPMVRGDWDVFDSSGRFVGTVKNPDGLTILQVTRDAVYGVWIDEFGVRYVRRHPLVRFGTSPDAGFERGGA